MISLYVSPLDIRKFTTHKENDEVQIAVIFLILMNEASSEQQMKSNDPFCLKETDMPSISSGHLPDDFSLGEDNSKNVPNQASDDTAFYHFPCDKLQKTDCCWHTYPVEESSYLQSDLSQGNCSEFTSTCTNFYDDAMSSQFHDVILNMASKNIYIRNVMQGTPLVYCHYANCHTGMQAQFPKWYIQRAMKDEAQKTWTRALQKVKTFLKNDSELIPCIFTWTHGGHDVYLVGSFTDWCTNKIRMTKNGHEFITVQNLPRGVHHYKFIVDDHWKTTPNQPIVADCQDNINNFLDISNYRTYSFTSSDDYDRAPNQDFSQFVPSANDYTSDAPMIPVILSRCNCVASDVQSRLSSFFHVLANHLYHDTQSSSLFGPHVTCITSTFRWRRQHHSFPSICGQRYSTITYITFNPLFSYHGDPVFEIQAASLLRGIVGERHKSDESKKN